MEAAGDDIVAWALSQLRERATRLEQFLHVDL